MRALLLALMLTAAGPFAAISVAAETEAPYSGTVEVETNEPFMPYTAALKEAIKENGFTIIGIACANCAIKGVFNEIVPGNRVFLFFRPDFARRMLNASTAAGIEAPIRLYVTEETDGSAIVTYRLPSHVFGAYGNDALAAMGRELDAHVEAILKTAAAKF